jgi:5-methylcytosine-specific restriction enzyme A
MQSDNPFAAGLGSTSRTMRGGRSNAAELPRGDSGRALCRWCSLEVPSGRRTFCSEWCVHEWKLRTDPSYLRDRVLTRDRGVCALCRVDTLSAWIRIKKARGERRFLALQQWGLTKMTRSGLWDADHIIPVVEGGGECDLSNIRTLCLKCHRQTTADLRKRRFQAGPIS